ncbi:DUF819 family protein [Thermosynechococcus sp. JY1334]|uniref:DUF819 family protein n=1 Tax=unclassified Thermosynechococcus TaxID=2622553 RepID=UPI0026721340|nr:MULTISPECIES: DUF819 family protein [unclassified Thermosynechococcus]MDR7898050.1 DUF819 family protein [Thermosynechococcus sp. JY1332]MDR7905451.1 DUF819 family protein [Thermosynechococcus sp. JY1334]WKT85184.1 DUF819 family protein [Thermosynechococcus sp. JY1339]WNC54125.1 DUF819 family protein [Thermosynechococcus sp. JY1331]
MDDLILWGILSTLTALGLWLEQRFPWAARLGSALIVLILAAICANLGLIPQQSPVYDTIYGTITSLAIVWLLLLVNLQDVRRLGRSALLAFGLASCGTLVGALLAGVLFHRWFLGDTRRLAGSLAASYIGGSINFVGVGRALNLSDLLFSAATTADNLLTAVWLAITLTLPSLLARFYPPRDAEATVRVMPLPTTSAIAPVDLAILLSLAIAILVLSTALHQFWPLIPTVVWLTTLSLALAQFKWMRYLRGTGALGMFGLNLFFTVIGAGTHVPSLIPVGLEMILFTTMIVFTHGLVTFGLGALLKLDVELLALASQATVGGPTTAVAQATGRHQPQLMGVGITLGLLGYAIASYLGLALAQVLGWMGLG